MPSCGWLATAPERRLTIGGRLATQCQLVLPGPDVRRRLHYAILTCWCRRLTIQPRIRAQLQPCPDTIPQLKFGSISVFGKTKWHWVGNLPHIRTFPAGRCTKAAPACAPAREGKEAAYLSALAGNSHPEERFTGRLPISDGQACSLPDDLKMAAFLSGPTAIVSEHFGRLLRLTLLESLP